MPREQRERYASSINEKPRDTVVLSSKVITLVCLRVRGKARALTCFADRLMLRRKKDTGRKEGGMVKGSTGRGGLNDAENQDGGSYTYSSVRVSLQH